MYPLQLHRLFLQLHHPFRSGGQPAQIYYMSKDGLDVSISTLVLMIVTITYKAVLVLVGFVVLIFMSPTVHTYMGASRYLLYLGMGLNVIAVTRYDDSGVCAELDETDSLLRAPFPGENASSET